MCDEDLTLGFNLYEMQQVVVAFQPISVLTDNDPSARLQEDNSGSQFADILPNRFEPDLLELWAGELGDGEFHELLMRWPMSYDEASMRYFPAGPVLYNADDMFGINLTGQAFANGVSNLVQKLYITDSNAFSSRANGGNVRIVTNLKVRFIATRSQGGTMRNISVDTNLLFTQVPNLIETYVGCATYIGPVSGFRAWLETNIQEGFTILPLATKKNPFGQNYQATPALLYGVRIQFLVNPSVAGCQTAGHMNFAKVRSFTEMYDIWDVPATNNNCIFAVLRQAMGSDFAKNMHGKTFYKKIRDTLQLFPNEKVPLVYCKHLSEMFKVRIELYDATSIYPQSTYNPTFTEEFTPETVRTVRMFIEDEHAYWIREKDTKVCPICNDTFDGRGYTRHEKRCKERKNLIQWKCCDCGKVENIPKTDTIKTSADLTDEYISEKHKCNQRKMSFYQRMIVAKAQKARGEPSERSVRPLFIPNDLDEIDLNDAQKVSEIGRHILDEYEALEAEQDTSTEAGSSSSRKRKRGSFAVWRYLCEDKLYCIDIETFADPNGGSSFVPYSVGTWFSERDVDEQYVEFHGSQCMDNLYDDMLFWKRKTGIRTILTFNGRGFDFNFILRAIVEGSQRHNINHGLKNIIPNGSNIMGFKWGRARSFDLFSFLMTSLAKACAEFKVDSTLQKASFPHSFMNSQDSLHYIGPIPDAHFWPDAKKIPTFEKRVEYFGSEIIANQIWPDRDSFRMYEFSSFYLKKDVLGMLEVYRLFSREVYARLRMNICYYLTAPALAYDMFRSNMSDFFLPLPRDEQMQAFFQCAVYGGRVYPRRLAYESSAYEIYDSVLREVEENPSVQTQWLNQNLFDEVDKRISETFDESYFPFVQKDYICDMDVVSLYPTAMMSFYPCGKMYVCTATELHVLETMVKEDPSSLIRAWDLTPYEALLEDEMPSTTFYHLDIGHGVFQVDITPNCSLIEPVLPRKDGNLTKWDLQTIEKGVYTSIDLCRALMRGYTITKFHSGISFQGIAPVLRNHILAAKAYKEEGDRDPINKAAIRTFGKLILNSTYGKFLQKPRFNVVDILPESKICENLRKYGWEDIFKIIDDGSASIYVVSSTKLDDEERMGEISKPTYMGAFVLSHSRRIMDRIYHTADPCGNCISNLPFYGDTDSLLLPAHTLPRLDQAGLVADPKQKRFGQVSNENGDARIIRGFFLAPKLYAFEYVTNKSGHFRNFHIRAKGVPSSMLDIQHYEKMDEQRWKYLTGQIQHTDEELCRISYESFLRTGIKQRSRTFKPGELVALREKEKKDQEKEDDLLLAQLQFLQSWNDTVENLEQNPVYIPVSVPPVSIPSKTRIQPFSVLLTFTSRSISRSIYSERNYDLQRNLLLPKHFVSTDLLYSCCDTQLPWLDGYLVKRQQIS